MFRGLEYLILGLAAVAGQAATWRAATAEGRGRHLGTTDETDLQHPPVAA